MNNTTTIKNLVADKVQELKTRSLVAQNPQGRPKGNRPDADLVAYIEGEKFVVGAVWDNSNIGKKTKIKISLHDFPNINEFEAYVCPRIQKKKDV